MTDRRLGTFSLAFIIGLLLLAALAFGALASKRRSESNTTTALSMGYGRITSSQFLFKVERWPLEGVHGSPVETTFSRFLNKLKEI